MYPVFHSPSPDTLNFTWFFNLNIFSFLFSFTFICLVISLRHSIVDLKHRWTLFCSMYVLAVVETSLNLLTLFQVRYLKILLVTSKGMFGSFHSDTCTLFSQDGLTFLISKCLFPFTVKSRFFTRRLVHTMFVCGVNWFCLFRNLSSFLSMSQRLCDGAKRRSPVFPSSKLLSNINCVSGFVHKLY